ncbi:GNAT family N-acetyltransferase [Eggerthellaceae bacterium zg-1084]|uniref:GNAT family N-acetyltransferase n=1 Tax=Berryella wangjianweii TaxID=2734634 RepID=UPI001552B4B2|nr:GNAT family N-acetyltransferase [Berryella wangjianweii]NPD30521.1 GNAT family N-acetyltransferase [Berryella wangjianweii]
MRTFPDRRADAPDAGRGLEIRAARTRQGARSCVRALYEGAFPEQQRMPWWLMTALSHSPRVGFSSYFDRGAFCGFSYRIDFSSLTYLLFLAVDEQARSSGVGSRILEGIRAARPEVPVVLDIEAPCEGAPSHDQRIRRMAFYRRNGFRPAPCLLRSGPITYQVMSTPGFPGADELARRLRGPGRLFLGGARVVPIDPEALATDGRFL